MMSINLSKGTEPMKPIEWHKERTYYSLVRHKALKVVNENAANSNCDECVVIRQARRCPLTLKFD